MNNTDILYSKALESFEVRKDLILRFGLDKKDFTASKLRELVESGQYELWELFAHYLQHILGVVSQYSDKVEDRLQFENFFWTDETDIKEGAWIRVKTEKGFNVYWAKKAKKTIDFDKVLRKFRIEGNKTEKVFSTGAIGMTSEELENQWQKSSSAFLDYEYCTILSELELQPLFVSVQRTKTQKIYLAPTEYELVNDINVYVDIVLNNKTEGVKTKAIYTSENENLIFYMQSRGIDREKAKVLALLKQCHFIVDMEKLYHTS